MKKIRVNKIIANISKYVSSIIIIYMCIKSPPINIENAAAYLIGSIGIWLPFLPIDFALLFEKIFSKTLDKIKEVWYNYPIYKGDINEKRRL